jgi:hypothetical protein
MDHKLNLDGKIDNDLTEIVQAKWEKVMNETGAHKLALNLEVFAVLRVYFQLAYQEGQTDMLDTMRDVYHNNPDHFEYMFEEDEVLRETLN